jgi:hypothetical protein
MYARRVGISLMVTTLLLSSVVTKKAWSVPQAGQSNAARPGAAMFSYVRNTLLQQGILTGSIQNELQAARAQEIVDTLRAFYGIVIEVDWGWSLSGPFNRSLVWDSGSWRLSTLEAVLTGANSVATAMGGADIFRQAYPQGLRFEKGASSKHDQPQRGRYWLAQTLPSGQTIVIFAQAIEEGEQVLTAVIAHELVHAWNRQQGGQFVAGLLEATGGSVEYVSYFPQSVWIGHFCLRGCWQRYYFGSTPPSGGQAGPGEDLAYSAQGWIMGQGLSLTLDRQAYLAQILPGVHFPE